VMIKGYSAQELSHAIRLEKNGLCVERRVIVKRLNEIDNRITELDRADTLLEGGF
jgi:hypothetical protein